MVYNKETFIKEGQNQIKESKGKEKLNFPTSEYKNSILSTATSVHGEESVFSSARLFTNGERNITSIETFGNCEDDVPKVEINEIEQVEVENLLNSENKDSIKQI